MKPEESNDQDPLSVLVAQHELLCLAASRTSSQPLAPEVTAHLMALERMIDDELIELANKRCPENFISLLQSMRTGLQELKACCQFPGLADKVVVGLGGSFSAGKSTFINALLGERRFLAAEIDPTTSLPTYIIKGHVDTPQIRALNSFGALLELNLAQFRTLTHDGARQHGSVVSGLLDTVMVQHPQLAWDRLALLDTPGYSKADGAVAGRTDAALARSQLNRAQFIIWLVPVDKGTLTEEDLCFLASLDAHIPKLVLVSRADKLNASSVTQVVAKVRETLAERGVPVLDVLPVSVRGQDYPLTPVKGYLDKWNQDRRQPQFAVEFKRLFMAYRRHLDKQHQTIETQLHRLNRILALADVDGTKSELQLLKNKASAEFDVVVGCSATLEVLENSFISAVEMIYHTIGLSQPYFDSPVTGTTSFRSFILKKNLNGEKSFESLLCNEYSYDDFLIGFNAGFDFCAWGRLLAFGLCGKSHYIARFDYGFKEKYAVMLCAALIATGEVTDSEFDVLALIFSGVGLEYSCSYYMREAELMSEQKYEYYFNSLRDDRGEAAESFLFDFIAILSLRGRLSDFSVVYTSELSCALDISKFSLKIILFWLSQINSCEYGFEISGGNVSVSRFHIKDYHVPPKGRLNEQIRREFCYSGPIFHDVPFDCGDFVASGTTIGLASYEVSGSCLRYSLSVVYFQYGGIIVSLPKKSTPSVFWGGGGIFMFAP